MADTKISALTNLTDLADDDRIPVADASDLTVTQSLTLATLRTFLLQSAMRYVKRLGSDHVNSSEVSETVTGLTATIPSGDWRFDYWLVVQLNPANTIQFAINHTGTTSSFVMWISAMGSSAAAAVGAWDQEINATTGFILSSYAARAENTFRGAGVSVDTVNAPLLVRITGVVRSTTSGDLELRFGTATSGTTVSLMSDSALILQSLVNTV